jgi:hypothetical protein
MSREKAATGEEMLLLLQERRDLVYRQDALERVEELNERIKIKKEGKDSFYFANQQ